MKPKLICLLKANGFGINVFKNGDAHCCLGGLTFYYDLKTDTIHYWGSGIDNPLDIYKFIDKTILCDNCVNQYICKLNPKNNETYTKM